MPDIVLAAGKQNNRRDAEQVGGLVTIGKWPEAALIDPGWKGSAQEIECDRNSGQNYDAGDEEPQLETDRAEVGFLGGAKI